MRNPQVTYKETQVQVLKHRTGGQALSDRNCTTVLGGRYSREAT